MLINLLYCTFKFCAQYFHRFPVLLKKKSTWKEYQCRIHKPIRFLLHFLGISFISYPRIVSLLTDSEQHFVNSLAPGRSGGNFENVVFKLALLICIFKSSCDNVTRWIPQELTDNKSTLVQVMVWYRQATSHYLNQCWPRPMSLYGVTRPQWVNI